MELKMYLILESTNSICLAAFVHTLDNLPSFSVSLTYKDCSGLNLDQISSGPNLEVSRIFHLSSFSWGMHFENKRAIAVTLLRQAQGDFSPLPSA